MPAQRLTAPELFLEFLVGIGLDLRDALFVHSDLIVRLYGFVLFIDYRTDAGEPTFGRSPARQAWLDNHPELDLPLLRLAQTQIPNDAEELFERLIDEVVHTVERLSRYSRGD